MEKNVDLLSGNILTSLTELTLPIMATSLVQAVYNLAGMARIGMVGSDTVAAVGAAATYTWLSSGVAALARMGGQVKSAHAYGERSRGEAVQYREGALQLALILATAYGVITGLFAGPLMDFSHLNSSLVVKGAIMYLRTVCGLILFAFIGQTLTSLYTTSGNSRTLFVANYIGVGVNIVLDPLLIFGLRPIRGMGVAGTAVATVTAQFIASPVLVIFMRRDPVLTAQMRIWTPTPLSNIKTVVRIGFPTAIQSVLYCGISMVLTRFVATWGDTTVAVRRVGGQIESVSWMTADGFGVVINAFIGQNYGAGNLKRVKKGYMMTSAIMFIWSVSTTCLLIFGTASIFNLFIHEPGVIPAGTDYLRIIGFSEVSICVRPMTVGILSGIGKIMEVSVITIILTTACIPLAVILGGTALGLNGIWWTLTISSIIRGAIFLGYHLHIIKGMKA